MTHPNDVNAGSVEFYAMANLRIHGKRTLGFCQGILNPRVYLDRSLESRPGFEALCYHEGTHAYERHRFVALLVLLPGLLGIALTIALAMPWAWIAAPASAAGWVWWCRQMEARADAVALYGAGHREFFSFLRMVGTQSTWWGRWCYGGDHEERTKRAMRVCNRRGWRVGP